MTEVDRLKSLIGRYALHVGYEEGYDFLDSVYDLGEPISKVEAKEIIEYRDQQEQMHK